MQVQVEKWVNGYYFSFPWEPNHYYLDLTLGKEPKIYKAKEDGTVVEEEVKEMKINFLLSLFVEIQHLRLKRVWWTMCQMIESWWDNEKVQDARKNVMWQQLERSFI